MNQNAPRAMTRTDSRGSAGYTLIEVMIAMAILGIGLLSIAVAQISAMKIASRSKNMQQAMFLAREAMDDIDARLPGDAFLTSAATTDDPNNPLRVNGTDLEDGTAFTRSVTVTPNSPESGVSRVIVTVTWLNSGTTATNQIQLNATKRLQ
jgi:prepilin-type N-terminal cleavage/methylation domain-containing protein